MKAITVKELFEYTKLEMVNGNGNRKILISSDDEGNSYHELFFQFTHTKGKDIDYALPISVEDFDKNYVILG